MRCLYIVLNLFKVQVSAVALVIMSTICKNCSSLLTSILFVIKPTILSAIPKDLDATGLATSKNRKDVLGARAIIPYDRNCNTGCRSRGSREDNIWRSGNGWQNTLKTNNYTLVY